MTLIIHYYFLNFRHVPEFSTLIPCQCLCFGKYAINNDKVFTTLEKISDNDSNFKKQAPTVYQTNVTMYF